MPPSIRQNAAARPLRIRPVQRRALEMPVVSCCIGYASIVVEIACALIVCVLLTHTLTAAAEKTHRCSQKNLDGPVSTDYQAGSISGNPKRGNKFSVSRKEFTPAIRSPANSRTIKAQAL